jgi:spermidine synthase
MPRPFEQLDAVVTPEGLLELRRRGDKDFMILIGGRVLMTSNITTSERVLAQKGCQAIAGTVKPNILIGGLGLGFTLESALQAMPSDATVVVAELNEKVIDWCRGPVAAVNGGAALDERVRLIVADVTKEIARVAAAASEPRYDAILWDLYVGPTRNGGDRDPLYGDASLKKTCAALRVGGVFGVWCETPSPGFEHRLNKHGLTPELVRTKGGGLHHAVYLATKRPPRSERAPITSGSEGRKGV